MRADIALCPSAATRSSLNTLLDNRHNAATTRHQYALIYLILVPPLYTYILLFIPPHWHP